MLPIENDINERDIETWPKAPYINYIFVDNKQKQVIGETDGEKAS
jgi:hypothetical protein